MEQMRGECLERQRLSPERLERCESSIRQLPRDSPRFLQSNDRWVSCLLGSGIFTGGFAELLAGLRNIQNVVDDLKRQADVVAEFSQGAELHCCAIGAHPSESNRTTEQSGGLALVNVS